MACTAAKSLELTKPSLFASPRQVHTGCPAVVVGVAASVEVWEGVLVGVRVGVAVIASV